MMPIYKLSHRMYAVSGTQASTTIDAPMIFLMQPLHPLSTMDATVGQGRGQTLHPDRYVGRTEHLYRRKKARRKKLKFEHVAQKFSLSIKDAARELKVSVPTLQLRCRELGIPKCPYRKVRSLETLIETMVELAPRRFEHAIGNVREEIEAIKLNPALEIKYETETLRQEIYDFKYKQQRTSGLT
ncbi:hypothetical protein LUZ63_003123 [Rhynchospora breviuscula]|uniref:RWP-RK domain-containing protein n=1 Tax=Rhynchospora breviuscula TaxID=2022672 RepID=A0A9Q0D040_9POAL|nr:hypothetical protein LUZ63_003123 [Rhynchospora breviuscula]